MSQGHGTDGPGGTGAEALGVPGHTGQRFAELVAVMDRLRSPGGCAWDGQQTHESLVRYLVEEAYEVVEAIEAEGGPAAHAELLVEELGDVLLQVVFHARVAQERPRAEGGFDVADVLEALTAKLVRRHPHVFGPGAAGDAAGEHTPDQLHARWEELKTAEKPERTGPFDGIPPHLPGLALAEKALARARKHGLEPPAPPEDPAAPGTEEELGRTLLALVRDASARGLDAERALRAAVREYVRAHEQG
ncbi:MazG family protein [Kocuria sp. LUK]|uniref:MazG family protein n=1 Tax=Kocuria sp. LUK TaxID=2897828 RepID=UPI001E39897C|nr:MazG family protein [Kocuria sp. LUK]MCD1144848.1 MazG family protein [Kocuria sp. LUK]